MKFLSLLFATTLLSACAHLPSDDEKTALRNQQNDLKKIETVMYNGTETGLYDQLKVCSMQLHDRVNPEVAFEWTEPVEKHQDVDYFADPDKEVSRLQYTLLVEKYKIFKQVSLARKDVYESRLKVCHSDLKAAMRREKIRSEQEQALLDKLSTAEKAARSPAAAPAPVVEAPPVAEAEEKDEAPAPPVVVPIAKPVVAAPAPATKPTPEATPAKVAGPAPELSLEDDAPAAAPEHKAVAPHSAMPHKVNASDVVD